MLPDGDDGGDADAPVNTMVPAPILLPGAVKIIELPCLFVMVTVPFAMETVMASSSASMPLWLAENRSLRMFIDPTLYWFMSGARADSTAATAFAMLAAAALMAVWDLPL